MNHFTPGMKCSNQNCDVILHTRADRYLGEKGKWNLCDGCGKAKRSKWNKEQKAKFMIPCKGHGCKHKVRKTKASGLCNTCEKPRLCSVCQKPFSPQDRRSTMHRLCALNAAKKEHVSKFAGVFREPAKKPGPKPRVEPLPEKILDTPAEKNRVAELLEKARRERVTLEFSRWS